MKTIINTIGYEEYLRSLDFEARNENVQELLISIKDYEEKTTDASISTYLQEISLYTDPIESRQDKHNSVSLMTVHVAKGSEYKVVFIIDMNDSIMPSTRANDNGDIEEERRIAYVAMTRAMKKLYLTCAEGYSFVSGGSLTPSRFIKEIGLKNLKVEKTTMVAINDTDLE
jgi:DNA helicase-2/ATP-dependent DNA helicase PcrA